MVKLRLYASRLTKGNRTRQIIAVDSGVRWVVLIAWSVCLLWYFFEIAISILRTHRFQSLCWLFVILVLPLSATGLIKFLEPDPSSLNASARVGRAIFWIVVLNALTAVLAILAARTVNPNYNFQTPLLRFSDELLNQFLN